MKNSLYGTAFHALDLQYVFLNMHNDLNEEDLAFARLVSEKYIRFAYGEPPWEPYHPSKSWGIFTSDYKIESRNEIDDESVRHYTRWDTITQKGIMPQFQQACES